MKVWVSLWDRFEELLMLLREFVNTAQIPWQFLVPPCEFLIRYVDRCFGELERQLTDHPVDFIDYEVCCPCSLSNFVPRALFLLVSHTLSVLGFTITNGWSDLVAACHVRFDLLQDFLLISIVGITCCFHFFRCFNKVWHVVDKVLMHFTKIGSQLLDFCHIAVQIIDVLTCIGGILIEQIIDVVYNSFYFPNKFLEFSIRTKFIHFFNRWDRESTRWDWELTFQK